APKITPEPPTEPAFAAAVGSDGPTLRHGSGRALPASRRAPRRMPRGLREVGWYRDSLAPTAPTVGAFFVHRWWRNRDGGLPRHAEPAEDRVPDEGRPPAPRAGATRVVAGAKALR